MPRHPPLEPTTRRRLRLSLLRISGAVSLALLFASGLAGGAQPAEAQDSADTLEASPRAAQLEQAPNRVRRQLGQLDALVAEADWTEAIELLETILADVESSRTVIEAAPGYFVSLAEHCHARLASLPAEALELYRARVDPAARLRYEQAIRTRDEALLKRVVNETFCSSWGDDALLALGEIALERGDYAAARRHWRRLDPRLSDPSGRPLSWALVGVNLAEHGPLVVERLTTAPRTGGWLVYPESDAPIAGLIARMAIASIQEGDRERTETEIAWLETIAPGAAGRIAGAERPLAAALREQLDAAAQQTDPRRPAAAVGPLMGRLWPAPKPLRPWVAPRVASLRAINRGVIGDAGDLEPPPVAKATLWGRTVIYRDGPTLVAVDLLTGEPAISRRGVLHQGVSADFTPDRRPVLRVDIFPGPRLAPNPLRGLFEAPTIAGDLLYARVGPDDSQPAGGDAEGLRIIGRDLSKENLTTLELAPPQAPWSFGGPPVVDGDLLYAPITGSDIRPRAGVACYSTATGRPLWKTPLASGPPASSFGSQSAPAIRLQLGGDALYVNTGFGAIASVDRHGGAVRWVVRCEPPATDERAATVGGDCLLDGDRLYVATGEEEGGGSTIFALDTATGQPLWRRSVTTGDAHLLGVDRGVVIVGGEQITGLDAGRGRRMYQFPDSAKAGLRGMGRGCLVGGEVFWPTRDRLFVLNAATGAATRASIDIADLGGAGANVAPANGCLIVAGTKAMTVLGPVSREANDIGAQLSFDTNKAVDER